jgi:ABC-2 type transport system permease protein
LTATPPREARAGVRTILGPKWKAAAARLRHERTGSPVKLVLLVVVGLGFWSGVFGVGYRVLRYLRGVPDIGDLLAGKMLGVVLLAFLSILLLSNIITSLSSFFLAKDLDMLVAAPVAWRKFYLAKLLETIVHSSWMVGLLAVPIFTAYGMAYRGGPLFPLVAAAALAPFVVLPAVAGCAITLLLVNVFPARRTRDLLALLAVGAVGVGVLLLRFIRPEQLARPEGFRSLVDYLVVLRAPTNPLLPSEWAAQMVMNWLLRVPDPRPIAALYGTAALALAAGSLLHRRFYQLGYSQAQEGAERRMRRKLRRPLEWALGPVPAIRREFILKDMRLFFRDNSQWSQLILLAVLLMVYIFNIKSLPLRSGEQVPFTLITAVSFLNLGLAGFVLAAVAARFVFPAVSLEGRLMWLLRSSPLDPAAMLWSKYWIGTVPLLVLALAITALTNTLLRASPFMLAVSLGTIVLFTLAVSALALTFGTFYPQFGTENAAQIPTSFGGLVYMMTSLSLLTVVIMIEAIPVAARLRAEALGESRGSAHGLAIAAAAVVTVCAAATVVPLRMARRRIEQMEW